MSAVLVPGGLLLVAVVVLDAALTTLSLVGVVPLAGWAARLSWILLHRLAGRGRRPHRVLRWSGTVVLTATFFVSVVGLWLGWFLVFSAGDATVVDDSGNPADGWSRCTSPVSRSSHWVSATTRRGPRRHRSRPRSACSPGCSWSRSASPTSCRSSRRWWTSGRSPGTWRPWAPTDPIDILRRNWNGMRFSSMFTQHLNTLTPEVIRLGERHLEYPVLHYFHFETRAKAACRVDRARRGAALLSVGVHPQDAGTAEPL